MTIFQQTPEQIQALLLIFVRIGAIVMTAPVLSSHRVPVHIRAGLSVLLAVILQPIVAPVGIAVSTSLLAFIFLAVKEVVVGLVIGYTANLIFSVVQMSGEMQDTQAGYGFAGVVDPNMGQQSAILGQFQMVMMWVIFFTVNGHHVLIQAVADSFFAIPVGSFTYNSGISGHMFSLAASLMMIALRIGAPVIAAMLLVDLALGILQRTAPQLNLIAVGFQVKTASAILVVIMALPFILTMQGDLVPYMNRIVHEVFRFGQ